MADFDERAVMGQDDAAKGRYLTFNIDSETYGLEISSVKEIIEMMPITKVPESPEFVEGIINLRGEIIGVLDVRKRFLKAPALYDAHTCIVVVEYEDYHLGLIVDSVNEVMAVEGKNISAPPSAKLNHYNQYIRNIGKTENGVVLLLSLDKLLQQDAA